MNFIFIDLFPDLHLNWERTKTIAAATSNTWGLFVLVSLKCFYQKSLFKSLNVMNMNHIFGRER